MLKSVLVISEVQQPSASPRYNPRHKGTRRSEYLLVHFFQESLFFFRFSHKAVNHGSEYGRAVADQLIVESEGFLFAADLEFKCASVENPRKFSSCKILESSAHVALTWDWLPTWSEFSDCFFFEGRSLEGRSLQIAKVAQVFLPRLASAGLARGHANCRNSQTTQRSWSPPNATSTMEEGVSLKRGTVSSLLNPAPTTVSQTEEERHSWRTHYFQIFDKPFLRLWDHYSGSQPDEDGCMKSRSARERLDTFKSRKDSLTIQIDHKAWGGIWLVGPHEYTSL
jgi:hypothetical protein